MIKTPYQNVLEAEQEAIEYAEENFPNEIELFKASYNELVNTLHHLNRKPGVHIINPSSIKSTKETFITFILSKFISSSIVAFTLIMKGYYMKARIILRSMLEDWELIEFFSLYPEKIRDWLGDKIKIQDIANILRTNSPKIGPIYKALSWLYHYYSDFVHPTREFLNEYLEADASTRIIYLQIAPVFKEEEFDKCIHVLLGLNGVVLHSLKQIFENYIRETQIENSINQILKSLGEYHLSRRRRSLET